jgi:glycosyltransferase involved in cell wall biosynthesis
VHKVSRRAHSELAIRTDESRVGSVIGEGSGAGPILKDVSRERTAELRQVAFVVGTTAGGTGAHVRMLAAGLARRGMAVSVFGPTPAAAVLGTASLPGVGFTPVEFGDRPRPGDAAAVLRLRRALRAAPPGVVHAHGLRAGALTVLALAAARGAHGARRRRPAIVVTVHNAPPHGGGAAVRVYRILERIVARGADLVLCVSPDLEQRMRAAGARRVGRAVVPAPDMPAGAQPDVRADEQPAPDTRADGQAVPAVPAAPATQVSPDALAAGAPMVFAAGRLASQKGFGVLLEAAARWRDLEPAPLLVIAGDGPLAGELRARAAALGVRAEFPGRRDDIPALLGSAAVFVLPSLWEGQPLVLQEALRAGVPVVATHTGGIPDLTGDDAALLVPPGDAARLADAVRSVLRDPALGARLRAAARRRGAALPSEDDAVAAVLACYADAARVLRLGY